MRKPPVKYPPLKPDQQALVVQWRGLAASIVKAAFGHIEQDALSEGFLGLCHAARLFDPTRGIRFQTYAAYWARAFVLRYLMSAATGSDYILNHRKLNKVFWRIGRVQRLLEKLGIEATDAEVAARIGVRESDVAQVRALQALPVQLDHPARQQGLRNDFEALPQLATEGESPEVEVATVESGSILRKHLRLAISRLDARERMIIRERWLNERPKNLRVLGETLGVSRERVRQIEERAIDKLRAWMREGMLA